MRKNKIFFFIIIIIILLGCNNQSQKTLPTERPLSLIKNNFMKKTIKIPFAVNLLSYESSKNFYVVNFEKAKIAYLNSQGKIVKKIDYSPGQITYFETFPSLSVAITLEKGFQVIHLLNNGKDFNKIKTMVKGEKVALVKYLNGSIVVSLSPTVPGNRTNSNIFMIDKKRGIVKSIELPGPVVSFSPIRSNFVFSILATNKANKPKQINIYYNSLFQKLGTKRSEEIFEKTDDGLFSYTHTGKLKYKKGSLSWSKNIGYISGLRIQGNLIIANSMIGIQNDQSQKIKTDKRIFSKDNGKITWERAFIRDGFFEDAISPDGKKILLTSSRSINPAYLFDLNNSNKAWKLPEANSGVFLGNNTIALGKDDQVSLLSIQN